MSPGNKTGTLESLIKIALPKGRLLNDTSALLGAAGWGLNDYSENARLYHLTSAAFPNLAAKIFQEKDIPIQVAIGNYDLGICGLDWIQELLAKYPTTALIKLRNLGYGTSSLFLAASRGSKFDSISTIASLDQIVSIASEYPNLAESLALGRRFKRFNIFPLWGAAEIYPPENADLVLLAPKTGHELRQNNLVPVMKVFDSSAFLIANRNSWETKDLSRVIQSLYFRVGAGSATQPSVLNQAGLGKDGEPFDRNIIRLALPDGHAQKHVVNILRRANIQIEGYPSASGERRPTLGLPGFAIKVIRPQDMPLQIANEKFDLAITGQDWVREHLYKFPSSPIREMLDLKYSRVKIVAAIHNDVPVDDTEGLRKYAHAKGLRLRLASEYMTIADKYARDNHLGVYQIIPTWGATEAFIPDEADLLIENTETGGTLRRHNLKIIEALFESTAWVIANSHVMESEKSPGINNLITKLQKGLEED
jgi:ATP phosphoribosyltransferase